jgi:branched-chain amino acid transport system permease protein
VPQGRLRTAHFGSGKARRTTGLPMSVAWGLLFIGGAWVVAQVLSAGNLLTFGQGIVLGIVMLSLVLLTGYGGQVSLCQMTFAGLGAFCMGKVLGGGSVVGLVAAFVIPAAVGTVLALVVLRLRDIYLALATLAFAYAMDNMFFNRELGFGGILHVGRVAAHSQRAFLVEVSALFVVAAIAVLALKRGEFGRRLAALNDSEVACVSVGMSITTTKVIAFTLAAGIAGMGGALYGGWQGQVGPNDFAMLTSLILLLLIALGGLGTVAGAFAAALFYAFQPVIQQHVHISNFTGLLVGLGAVSLGRNPGGFAGQLSDVMERVRGWRAARPTGELVGEGAHGEEAKLAGIAG